MTAFGHAVLRQLALKVLAEHAGTAAGAEAVAAAAQRTYDHLAHVLAPLIGQVGVDALTARALHLAHRQYPQLAQTRDGNSSCTEGMPETPPPEQRDTPFAQFIFYLERQDPAIATEAAGAVIATLTGLLVTFIGEPLTSRLLRKAWPDAFSDASTKET
jgi:hypothetical protein